MNQPSRTLVVALNAASNYARFGLNIVVWFFLTPYMIHRLGENDFGLWTLVFSVVGFFGLLDMGLGTGVVKFVAEAQGAGDPQRRNRLVSTIACVYLALALLASLGVALLSLFFNRIFSLPPEQGHLALPLLWLVALRAVILALPLGVYRSVLFGEQQIALLNLVQVVSNLAYGLLSWAILAGGGGVLPLAWAGLGLMLVEHLAYLVLARRRIPDLRLSPRLFDRDLLRHAVGFSFYSLAVNVAALILLRTDPVIVKLFLPLGAVALYGVVLRIGENSLLLTKQFINVLAPLVAQLQGSGESLKIRFVLVNCTKFACAPAAMLSVGAFCLGRPGLEFWVGPSFAEVAPVLWTLMLALSLSVPQMTASTVLTMTGGHRFAALAAMCSVLLNLAASLALVRPLGLLGVALGTLLTTLVVDIGLVLPRALARQGVPILDYVRQVAPAVLLPALVQAGITLGLLAAREPANLFQVVLWAAPGALAYLAVFWAFFLQDSEKELLRAKLLPARAGEGRR